MKGLYKFAGACIAVAALCSSCEQHDERTIETLTEETNESFPQTEEQAKKLQQEVDQLNKKIDVESQKRVQEIQKQVQEEKR